MLTRLTKPLFPVWAIAAMYLALAPLPGHAADSDFSDGITVDSTADAADATVGDNICDDGAGNCTLRAAIQEANATAGADTITVPAGVYTLTIQGVDERCDGDTPCTGSGTDADPYVPVITADASKGDLDITDTLTINGAGADSTVVEWGAGTAQDNNPLEGDRIFHIQATTASIDEVSINDLTMRGGSVGVIPNTDCTVTDNPYDIEILPGDTCTIWQFRRVGGAIAMGPGAAVVKYEEAVHGPGAGGGGGGGNMGPFPGGKPGEEEDEATIGAVTLDHVIMADNESGADAGALFNAAPTTLSNSVISGNFSGANGGGIYNDEALEVVNTTIGKFFDTPPVGFQSTGTDLTVGNEAENGGGMFDTGFHTTTIRDSAINGNVAIGGGGIAGRAGVVIDITNSTISDNTATDVGGGITTNGTVNLTNVTVANNTASTDAPGGGGGLNSFGSGSYNLYNTIVAGNTKSGAEATVVSNCGCSGGSTTCPPGVMASLGHNLEDDTTCALSGIGDLSPVDPLLADLADNNTDLPGLTETRALQTGSPAIDSADDTNCPNNDQRGSLRPADGDTDGTFVCDRGAYEVFIHTADLHINNMVAPDSVNKGDNFTVRIEVHNDDTASSSVNNVQLTSTLPAGLSFVSATPTGPGTPTCSEAAGTVTCGFGTLDIGETATADIVANAVDATNAGDNPYKIAASVTADEPPVDTLPDNNTASVNVSVLGASDMQLTASADKSSVTVKKNVTVTFTVNNNGPDDATNVRLGGTLPSGVTLVSATPDKNGASCSQVDDEVICELGTILASTPTVNVVAVLKPTQTGTKTVSAAVSADQTDADDTNDTASATVTVNAESDGGGFCSYHPNGRFDPVFPLLLLAGIGYLLVKSRSGKVYSIAMRATRRRIHDIDKNH